MAVGLLARREHSRRELEQKLATRGHPPEEIQRSLDELESQGLLDEGRFVEAYVRNRVERGYGPVRIRAELETRGIPAALITQFLDASDELWLASASEQYRKRFGEDRACDYGERAKRAQFLQRRGFSSDVVRTVVGGW